MDVRLEIKFEMIMRLILRRRKTSHRSRCDKLFTADNAVELVLGKVFRSSLPSGLRSV